MRQSWPLLVVAFGALFVLIVASGILVVRDSTRIFNEMERVQQTHQRRNRLLRRVEPGAFFD